MFGREEIRQILTNKKLSIKFDTSKRFGRNNISINLQFYDSEIRLINLAIKPFRMRAKANNLNHLISEIFYLYGINQEHIISITIDNGANMIKDAHLLSESQLQIQEMTHKILNIRNNTY